MAGFSGDYLDVLGAHTVIGNGAGDRGSAPLPYEARKTELSWLEFSFEFKGRGDLRIVNRRHGYC